MSRLRLLLALLGGGAHAFRPNLRLRNIHHHPTTIQSSDLFQSGDRVAPLVRAEGKAEDAGYSGGDGDGEGLMGEAVAREAELMVDELIRKAQQEAREGGGALPGEDELEASKRMMVSMFDEGANALSDTAKELAQQFEDEKVEYDAAAAARKEAEAADFMSRINSLAAGMPSSSASASASSASASAASTGDPSVDAALAKADAKLAARAAARAGGGGGGQAPPRTCVLVGPLGGEDGQGSVSSLVAAGLEAEGWQVLPWPGLDLNSAKPAAAALPPPVAEALAEAVATETGVCLCVVPGAKAKERPKPGLFGMTAPSLPAEALDPVDPNALAALLKALEGGVRHVCMLSCAGVERRKGEFPYGVINTLGALDKRRSAEQALQLRSKQVGYDYTLVRVAGWLDDDDDTAEAVAAVAAPGDQLDDPASPQLAAGVLLQSLLLDTVDEPAAPSLLALRNASLGVAGGVAGGSGVRPPPSPLWWAELLLPVDGPELFRAPLRPNAADEAADKADKALRGAVAWVQAWAQNWTPEGKGKGKGPYTLTTKVVVRATPNGARLLFNPTPTAGGYAKNPSSGDDGGKGGAPRGSKVGLEGGVEVVVDLPLEGQQGGLRVRAKRCGYGEGAVVKEMSEEAILRRLKDDVERFVKNAY